MQSSLAQTDQPIRKPWKLGKNQQAFLLFLGLLVLILGVWELGVKFQVFSKLMPSASDTIKEFWFWISDPFFDYGPNDKGIGWHLLVSLRRVLLGFAIGSAIAIPLGILIGLSEVVSKAVDPYIQILRPVSPLAWLPLGLGLLQSSEKTALFVIAITSIWPTLINTKFGVSNVDRSYLDVARVLLDGVLCSRSFFQQQPPVLFPDYALVLVLPG